jgi:hypothetical protein
VTLPHPSNSLLTFLSSGLKAGVGDSVTPFCIIDGHDAIEHLGCVLCHPNADSIFDNRPGVINSVEPTAKSEVERQVLASMREVLVEPADPESHIATNHHASRGVYPRASKNLLIEVAIVDGESWCRQRSHVS